MSSRSTFPTLLLAAAWLASGCSESHPATDAGTDATITFDAPPAPEAGADATPDSGPLPGDGEVGAACTSGADCEGNLCIGEGDGFPEGYCTSLCTGGMACPDGSACVQVSRTDSVCFDVCDPAGAPKQCRPGYGCATSPYLPQPVCMPGCEVDADCGEGLRCDPTGGFGGAGQCYDPSAEVGQACTSERECPESGFCLGEGFAGWPGGSCITSTDCDVEADTGCPGDAHCLPAPRGGTLCVDGCETDGDCRDGYTCQAPDESRPDRKICYPACSSDDQCTVEGYVCYRGEGTCSPPFDPSEYGSVCARRHGGCVGGTCLFESESGLPGSYCAYLGCDPTQADASDGCPGDGVCWQPEADATPTCMAPCDEDGDCREGYACRDVDATRPERGKACLPACSSDAQCTADGFTCDAASGRCVAPMGG